MMIMMSVLLLLLRRDVIITIRILGICPDSEIAKTRIDAMLQPRYDDRRLASAWGTFSYCCLVYLSKHFILPLMIGVLFCMTLLS
jgi:hypothetical protein